MDTIMLILWAIWGVSLALTSTHTNPLNNIFNALIFLAYTIFLCFR